ncbi:MAG: H4MPT-linked C1 transfer pathway protein [Xanthobacteraceae bacterium]|nr:H4MPT-linked C1 transfer pathway protein [Xanthobacteraceae bacterium]
MSVVIGWDIGGVHLKAARAEHGIILEVVQVPSPLRFGLAKLADAFAQAKTTMGAAPRHAVTMTAELADTFASRQEGVAQLAALAAQQLDGDVKIYAGRAGFVAPSEASNHVLDVASANWHASACLIGRLRQAALLIDLGSTTTDIIPIAQGRVAARGYTDAERLASGELIYAGLVRSFVMATANRAPFAGQWTTLINENFANMADVYRVLGNLPEGVDQMATADGREKSFAASCARLARMLGRDAADASEAQWRTLAAWLAEAQIRSIADGAMLVLSQAELDAAAPVVGAGIGIAVVEEVARRLGRSYIGFADLIDAAPLAREHAAQCGPAAALAALASQA